MNSRQVRQTFLDFFKGKQHEIVSSAPMVVKNDPTLMFTNAGMNQFKDLFLGNSKVVHPRIADTQKCLRVSGKHNDLEEVGHDTYHHTMFEMLGNWSFGDYFKKEAIAWAWELLTEVYKINKSDLYVTVFGGDKDEKLAVDDEALAFWKGWIDEDRILFGNKKDNFWEMGDTGPCGPCSEVHVDLRSEADKKKRSGKELVNTGNPLVIEIWNLVFIEFNRKADGRLEMLPSKHVDTGMGFERLCMVLQGKKSNYDTDVFQPLLKKIAECSGRVYGNIVKDDVAMRVIADHLRAVVFAIADGQLPSNNKAGYVIRRILRRAVRYGFTFLDFQEPMMHNLVPVLVAEMGDVFPEIKSQQELIMKVIREEEQTFLRTLSVGIGKFEHYIQNKTTGTVIDGTFAFELFDTYGFPIDLTQLMAREKSLGVDMDAFAKCMDAQKNRSRQAAEVEQEDWVELSATAVETVFVGYDEVECDVRVVKYRVVKVKGKEEVKVKDEVKVKVEDEVKVKDGVKVKYQIVLDRTPFYAESGGQAGDRGLLFSNEEKIEVENTIRENSLIIHITSKLPADLSGKLTAQVDSVARLATARNHSATHLLHAALKEVLGSHVEQKGSLVEPMRLRFDFAHFSKMTDEEIVRVEQIVNAKIRENIPLKEHREMPIAKAREMGAVALFGEKYGEQVRVIAFDPSYSIELCGGTHVSASGMIGFFKIISEGAIAAGIRRIEAITGKEAETWILEQSKVLSDLKELLKGNKDLRLAAETLIKQNADLVKQVGLMMQEKVRVLCEGLLKNAELKGDVAIVIAAVEMDPANVKNLAFELRNNDRPVIVVIASVYEGKPMLTVAITESLAESAHLDASAMIKELAAEIKGGGGGQKFYATAGGKDATGIPKALEKARTLIAKLI